MTDILERPLPSRASAQARIAAGVARVFVRPLAANVRPNSFGIAFTRRAIATTMSLGGKLADGTTIERVDQGDVHGDWVRAPGVTSSDRVVLYIHGSAYVACSARTHRKLASQLSRASGLAVFVVDYRLAPEHLFPAAADDVAAAYRWLLGEGHSVAVAGDSAGGHLALDLLIENDRTGVPQPTAVALLSPVVDLTFRTAATRDTDPMISARGARRLVSLYTEGQSDDLPRLRLTLPTVDTLPPLLVQAGGAEMLRADARYLREVYTQAGGACSIEIWPGQMHVFQALPRMVPEATRALRRTGAFLSNS